MNAVSQDSLGAMSSQTIANQTIGGEDLLRIRLMVLETGVALDEAAAETLGAGITAADAIAKISRALGYLHLASNDLRELDPDFETVSFPECMSRRCVVAKSPQPRRDGGPSLMVVVTNPFDDALNAWLERRAGQTHVKCLATNEDIQAFLNRSEESVRALDTSIGADETLQRVISSAATDLSLSTIAEDSSPVIKLVNSTIFDALRSGASDVHLESHAGGLAVKYRIDGVLTTVASLNTQETAERAISRIKVMAELDIAEKRVPQDGRFKVSIKGREIDIRVSIMPSLFGEDSVLRILDKQTLADKVRGLRLDTLGFDASSLVLMRRLSREPYGMVLVTGPTGSGKTTTLYAAISEINTGQDKIVTIEDPVEYQLPGVLQIPVNEKKGLTFARGLRSILRHDPDRILVGEIRDPETAQIAVQSALTGHLVFTSVHANNVFDVIGRILHMGVDPYSFVSSLNGVIAQRLVRLACTACKFKTEVSPEALADSGIGDPQNYLFMGVRGCGQCRGTGYKGRKAIAEILKLDDELREMITRHDPIRQLKEAARKRGTRFLREAALDLLRSGETTLAEIDRVTFVD